MTKKKKEDIVFEELSSVKMGEKDISLFDQADKPFLTLYLFIFIFGIILTVVSI